MMGQPADGSAGSVNAIGTIVCATNANDIVHRVLSAGDLSLRYENIPTLSPAMDIQFAYNLERMLYYMLDQETLDYEAIREALGKKRVRTGGTAAGNGMQRPEVDDIHELLTEYMAQLESTSGQRGEWAMNRLDGL
jgi:threonine synthase